MTFMSGTISGPRSGTITSGLPFISWAAYGLRSVVVVSFGTTDTATSWQPSFSHCCLYWPGYGAV